MKLFDKKVLREMMEKGELKDSTDISRILKGQFGEILEEMLEVELDEKLGYTKYYYKNKTTSNSRKGKRSKRVRADYRAIEIDVPRNRENEFEPKVVKKNQKDI